MCASPTLNVSAFLRRDTTPIIEHINHWCWRVLTDTELIVITGKCFCFPNYFHDLSKLASFVSLINQCKGLNTLNAYIHIGATALEVLNIPKFEQKYTEEDFLKVLGGEPKTVGYIAKLVGCSRSTAVTYLNTLKEKKKVTRMSIDDGNQFAWSLVEV